MEGLDLRGDTIPDRPAIDRSEWHLNDKIGHGDFAIALPSIVLLFGGVEAKVRR